MDFSSNFFHTASFIKNRTLSIVICQVKCKTLLQSIDGYFWGLDGLFYGYLQWLHRKIQTESRIKATHTDSKVTLAL